ncbi:MAG: MATE family efflux transporter [Rikenellaceae bacterium]|nr:MATE family efflux transporter [Rikenellaceae bacterium]
MRTQDSPLSLGTDSLSSLLWRYAMPAIIAQVSSSLYNIIDSIFVGQGVGPMAISGLALTMPVMNLSAAFGAMVGVGSSALTSIRLGQGNKRAAELILGNVVLLNVVMGVAFMALGLIYLDDLLYLFGASDESIPYAREFMRVILIGNVITHLYLGLNNQLRVTGYPQKAMHTMLLSVVLNLVLCPLFIFVFKWGIAGSAWATVIAQTVALGWQLHHFSNRQNFLSFRRDSFRFNWDIVRGTLSIGMAPFMMQCCACVVVIFVNNTMQHYGGDLAIGAYGIVNRVAFLFTMVVMGLNHGMQPIVGYNYGAKNYERVRRILFMTIGWATVVTTVGFLVCQLFPEYVVRLFAKEDGSGDATQLITLASHGLQTILIAFPIVGFSMVVGNFFQYIGKAKRAIILSMTRQLIFILPLLVVLPPLWGQDGVWYSIPIADTMAMLLALVLLIYQLRKLRRTPDSEHSI